MTRVGYCRFMADSNIGIDGINMTNHFYREPLFRFEFPRSDVGVDTTMPPRTLPLNGKPTESRAKFCYVLAGLNKSPFSTQLSFGRFPIRKYNESATSARLKTSRSFTDKIICHDFDRNVIWHHPSALKRQSYLEVNRRLGWSFYKPLFTLWQKKVIHGVLSGAPTQRLMSLPKSSTPSKTDFL